MSKTNPVTANATPDPSRIRIGEHVSLVKRGKRGVWTADYHFINADGISQHSRKSLGTKNRVIAEQRGRELEVKLTNGQFKPAPAGPTSIDTAIDQFITAKQTEGASPKTIVKYGAELKTYAAFLKQHRVTTLQRTSVHLDDAYRHHRLQVDKLESYTLYAHTMIRKSFLNWCVTRNSLAVSPLAGVKVVKPRRRRYPAATLEQFNRVLAGASGTLVALLAVLAFSGLRIGEVTALRPQDVDLAGGFLHIRRRENWGPKTRASERTVPIHRRLLAILKAVPRGRGGTFFNAPAGGRFPEGDHHLNPRDINEQFQILAKKLGFVVGRKNIGLTVHALRRTFKTTCYDAGVPKPMLDRWVGHEDQNDMDHFYYDPQKSREWIEKVQFGEPNEQDLKALKGVTHASPH